jgi:RNA polymerase sigma-70 factor (ECF subfamily)
MTGLRTEADDLSQEAVARAIERCDQVGELDPTGWLLRLTTRLCLDHLRHKKIERRLTELVDPLLDPDWPPGDLNARASENAAVLREDVRFAVMVALQTLSPRQRAVLILHDVCDQSLVEVGALLDTNPNAAKAVLHRARLALASARRHENVDIPVDSSVVEQFAKAIEAGSIDLLTELLATDVWGIVDGGGIVQTATKPTFGAQAVSRQWANAKRKLDLPVTAHVLMLNGEPSIVIRLRDAPSIIAGVVHLETRDRRAVALRIQRDPRRTAPVGALLQ